MPRTRRMSSEEEIVVGNDGVASSASNVIMTQETFSALIASLQKTQNEFCQSLVKEIRSSTPQAAEAQMPASVSFAANGNFAKCRTRYGGRADECVESFIDAICTYKDCVNMSEENALRGFSMLLEGSAAVWWQGIKPTTTSFQNALHQLKSAFGEQDPPHRIYQKIFSLKQGRENTDLFISKVRALFSRLPLGDLSEKVQVDMAYGLLSHRIRERLCRKDVDSFSSLLGTCRLLEESFVEADTSSSTRVKPQVPARIATPTRSTSGPLSSVAEPTEPGTDVAHKRNREFCAYCKRYGHKISVCEKLKVKSALNTIKSKCRDCNVTNSSQQFYSLSCRNSKTKTLVKHKEVFEPGGGAIPFAEQMNDSGDHSPIAVRPFRSTPTKKEVLRTELVKTRPAGLIPKSKEKLRANREKCVFARDKVKYLGHVITQDGILPDDDRVRAVLEMKTPLSLRQLKTFLQTCSWFREFIANFSEVAEPLTRLLEKNQPWVWSSDQAGAFEELKRRLSLAPILVRSDYSKPFVLQTEASNYSSVRKRVEKQHYRRKECADQAKKPDEVFNPGDQVLLKSHVLRNASKNISAKFVPKSAGPHVIIKRASPTTYLVGNVEDPEKVLGKFHVSGMTDLHNRDKSTTPPHPVVLKRPRGRPRKIVCPVCSVQERLRERGRSHELEGECIA